MVGMVQVKDVTKVYDDGFEALKGVSLEIKEGEIIALLGPNGAGKTTLISTICGITAANSGRILVSGHDVSSDYRAARRLVGLVPQEIALEPFETVGNTVRFSRGLFGKAPDAALIENILKDLSLWDKRDTKNSALSGGMRRRVLIAKALSHEPRVLFLDEPTAGVDVELRRDMWALVEKLRAAGVTIILTTHYIEEAEEIADRIAVINRGEILLVENKADLMARMGKKEMRIELSAPIDGIPDALSEYDLGLEDGGRAIVYVYDTTSERTGITSLLKDLQSAGITLRDVQTRQSTLEEIFVGLVSGEVA